MSKKSLIVDTYAIIADLTGSAPSAARRALDLVRLGEATGIVHYLIVYELATFGGGRARGLFSTVLKE